MKNMYEVRKLDRKLTDPVVVVGDLNKAKAKLLLMDEPGYVIDLRDKKCMVKSYYMKKEEHNGVAVDVIVFPKSLKYGNDKK